MDRYGLICRSIWETPGITQRELARLLDVSLGTANRLVNEAIGQGLIKNDINSNNYSLTEQGTEYLRPYKVDGALIMAAGFGSRFVPLTFETPKGLLEVFGERMIERQIKQLHAVGITDITIVVGYLKEKFDYLIDKYQVKLLYNPEYASKNNLATIYHAREILRGKNMYILSSDNWMRDNMYHAYECGAWYATSYMEGDTSEWCVKTNKKGRITSVSIGGQNCHVLYGPAFFSKEFSEQFLPIINEYYHRPGTEQFYWENAAVDHLADLELYANPQPEHQIYEFENLEELRLFDPKYQNHSDNEAMSLVSKVFHVPEGDITNIRCLKAGMTNKSFLFELHGDHYICRIPGPGTEHLINRKEEEAVYQAVNPLHMTEDIIYFDGETGYKIARYYEGARNADPHSEEDMKLFMQEIKRLHQSGLTVAHTFSLRERIDFYENLCRHRQEMLFEDYTEVRQNMNRLLSLLEQMDRPSCLAHVDCVPDNFLILPDGTGKIIDWEYAGMQDPHVDIAMFCIYSLYKKEQVDHLIDLYFEGNCDDRTRIKIYCYIAVCGLLWSNWCEYKRKLGVEFGEYSLRQYRYAKDYYKIVQQELGEEGKEICTK